MRPLDTAKPTTWLNALALCGIASVLGACGGDSGGSNYPEVEGAFNYVSVTGQNMPQATGDSWNPCMGDRYYETDWAVIYSDGGVSDASMTRTANAIHHYWRQVLGTFEMSESDFKHRYRHLLLGRYLNATISHGWEGDDWSPIDLLAVSDVLYGHLDAATLNDPTLAAPEWRRQVYLAAAPLPAADIRQLARDTALALGQNPDTFLDVYPDGDGETGETLRASFGPAKIVACIDSYTPDGSGSAMSWGILMGASARGDIIHHELVHYMQSRLMGGDAFKFAPRWFTEGQASFIAGQNIAGRNRLSDQNPVKVENCSGPSGSLDDGSCLSGNEPYDLYALSYKYVAAGTPMSGIRAIMENAYESGESLQPFKEQFDVHARKPDGSPLQYTEYQRDFYQLLSDYL